MMKMNSILICHQVPMKRLKPRTKTTKKMTSLDPGLRARESAKWEGQSSPACAKAALDAHPGRSQDMEMRMVLTMTTR